LKSGESLAQVEAPWAVDAQAEIANLYQQVLGRQPDPAGLASFTAQLLAGVPLQTIRNGIATSNEVVQDLSKAYAAIYGNSLSSSQISEAETELKSGESLAQVEAPWAVDA